MQTTTLTDIINCKDFKLALCQFLDDFKSSNDKLAMIATEPMPFSKAEKSNLCILAAVAHTLANENNLPVPIWVFDKKYIMPYPKFAFDTTNKDYQEFLFNCTPTEFASKNIYHGSNSIGRV